MSYISMSFRKHQAFILLVAALTTGLFLLYFIFGVIGRVPTSSYRELTDMVIEVQHKDGTRDIYASHLFSYSSEDDVITMHFPLDKSWKSENSSINFLFYNSIIKAYYNDKLLISYGEDIDRNMVGKLKVTIPVPTKAYGNEIVVVIDPHTGILEDTFRAPYLMAFGTEQFFPIIGQEAFYTVFSVILIFSFLVMIVFAFLYRTVHFAKEGTWLMALIFSITLWYMGNSGMVYMLTSSENISAVAEYIGMYLLFSSAPLYSSFETERPLVKKYLKVSGSILFVVFWVCLVLYILPSGFNYVWHLRFMQALQIVMVFSALLSLLFPGKKRKTAADQVMGSGLIGVALFGILEQIRIIVAAQITENWPPLLQWFAKAHFSIVLILILVLTLFTSYVIKVKDILQKSLREKHLEILAYTDNLTGLGNRQFLQRKLNILDLTREKDYAVIFIDINKLKYANDTFGHEAGDQLIQMVATSIKEAMEGNSEGFAGRNGGDEFICVAIPSGKVSSIARNIRYNLEKLKNQQRPPFPVGVSIGVATYREFLAGTSDSARGVVYSSQVIKLADERMYEDKMSQRKGPEDIR